MTVTNKKFIHPSKNQRHHNHIKNKNHIHNHNVVHRHNHSHSHTTNEHNKNNIKSVIISHKALKTRKRKRNYNKSKSQEEIISYAIQDNAIRRIKNLGKKTRKNAIPLKYDSIIKLNKPKEQKIKTVKTKENSLTYPRGILQGGKNFVPRKKVLYNIRTAKKRKSFNMLSPEKYEEIQNQNQNQNQKGGEVIATVKPIINRKKRTKTVKNKKFVLDLEEQPIRKRKFTPIMTKSFDANEIEKLMLAITYDGVMEMRIKKEN
jgi:hypothetical protein